MPKDSLTHNYRHTPGAPAPYRKPKGGFWKIVGIISGILIGIYAIGEAINPAKQFDPPAPTLTSTVLATLTRVASPTSTYPPVTPSPQITPTITLQVLEGFSCLNQQAERIEAQLVRVTDGDTVVVNIDGEEFKVRYIGIDSPESGALYASQATNVNTQLLAGGDLVLVKDTSETDRYDRLLRYVFANGKFVNYEMVKLGWAKAGSWPPDTACDSTFASAQSSAKVSLLGIWAVPPTAIVRSTAASTKPPAPLPIIIQPTKAPGGNCDPSYPDFCIPPPPPDLDCKDIPQKRFHVLPPDPHNFDRDGDGIGCES